MRDLNELAKRVHDQNAKWWTDLETGERITRNRFELLALVISELSEMLEGERKDLQDDHLPHRKMAEVEAADAVIRLCDYAGGFGIPFLTEYPDVDSTSIPDNKAAAIFLITCEVCQNPSSPEMPSAVVFDIEAYCQKHGYDLWGAVEEKLAYNQTRRDHSHEARKEANGKKW